jgi:flagellar basal-body rod protein FlgB
MFDNMFRSIDLMQNGLSAAWTRNAVIRNNIANAETPGFKASDVEFESLLRDAINEQGGGFIGAKTHKGHRDIGSGTRKTDLSTLSSISARVVEREGTSMLMNENNVDIDAENVKFAQNSLYYNTLLEKMNSEIRRLRMVISEAR